MKLQDLFLDVIYKKTSSNKGRQNKIVLKGTFPIIMLLMYCMGFNQI